MSAKNALYQAARPALFRLDPEVAHGLTLATLSKAAPLAGALYGGCNTPHHTRKVMGLSFPNAVGLAAGLDKDGACIDGLAALGFGFLEVGTVTPRAQPGNPRPRMFRLVHEQALINRLGFNNGGVDNLLKNLQSSHYAHQADAILGINIGKNFDTPLENAPADYLECMRKVYAWASYITVNISSPNTKGLRDLQSQEMFNNLLMQLKQEQTRLSDEYGKYVPLAVKIAPDLAPDALREMAAAIVNHEMDAVIATNTTIERSAVAQSQHAHEQGGLSGAPLLAHSNAALKVVVEALDGAAPVIGVGGIMRGQDARFKIEAGADLVQIYTGLIYRGPGLVRECVDAVD